MNESCAIKLENVCVRRGWRHILDIPCLKIQKGQCVNIIGPNGAGKTTLLKVCCGLVRPCKGTVYFNHCNIGQLNAWQKTTLRKDIGYLPQRAQYNPELSFTALEVVAIGRTARKPLGARLDDHDWHIAADWLKKLGLKDHIHQPFSTLSGGQQQKTLLARAMVQEPSLLILDEPLAGCDVNWIFNILEIIKSLWQEYHLTVLLVLHDLYWLPRWAPRTVLLNQGKIVADQPTELLLLSEMLSAVYPATDIWKEIKEINRG